MTFTVLPQSCQHNETMRDRTICWQDAGSALIVTFKPPLNRYDSTRTGLQRRNQPNYTGSQKVDMDSVCESKTRPPTVGSSVSPIGWRHRGC